MSHILRVAMYFACCVLPTGCAFGTYADDDPRSAQQRLEMMRILTEGMQQAANAANPGAGRSTYSPRRARCREREVVGPNAARSSLPYC